MPQTSSTNCISSSNGDELDFKSGPIKPKLESSLYVNGINI